MCFGDGIFRANIGQPSRPEGYQKLSLTVSGLATGGVLIGPFSLFGPRHYFGQAFGTGGGLLPGRVSDRNKHAGKPRFPEQGIARKGFSAMEIIEKLVD